MASLMAKYNKERLNRDTVESSIGFISYEVHDEHIYLADIFILPEHRGQGEGKRLTDLISELAKKLQVPMLSTIHLNTAGSENSLKAHLAYGFSIHSANNNILIMKKEV